jgi:hypothetical protein
MSCTPAACDRPGFDRTLAPLLCQDSLPFADVLRPEHVQQACDRHGVRFGCARNSILNPALTLWAWLSQVVCADKSTAAACVRVSVLLLALGRPKWSEDTGCYCRARSRLGSLVLRDLALDVADRLEQACPQHWRWQGRRVFLGDGSTLTLADTPENQAAFPQPTSQKKGLGFPMIRLVVLMSLATAALSGLSYGPYQGKQTGELALLLRQLDRLRQGDVLVADRYYCAYVLLASLRARGVDAVVRLHGNRKCDFRKGQRLGPKDHLVCYRRPPRPDWLSEEDYQQLPKELRLRELDVTLSRPGYRSERVVLVSTLLDAQTYPKAELGQLYRQRWLVEVDLRGLKQTLKIEHLQGKTPEVALAELWAHALGYNLTCKVLAQAAVQAQVRPRQLSLKGALQQLREYWQTLSALAPAEQAQAACRLLAGVARKRVGKRPGRQEPRAIKRRPGNRPMLLLPRAEAKRRLSKGRQSRQAQTVSKKRHR